MHQDVSRVAGLDERVFPAVFGLWTWNFRERISRQPRIVRLTEADYHVLQAEVAHPIAQTLQIFWYDIFCDDAAAGTDDRGQPYDVIAAACANVHDSHPGFDAE
jgi:hypothetical protein